MIIGNRLHGFVDLPVPAEEPERMTHGEWTLRDRERECQATDHQPVRPPAVQWGDTRPHPCLCGRYQWTPVERSAEDRAKAVARLDHIQGEFDRAVRGRLDKEEAPQ